MKKIWKLFAVMLFLFMGINTTRAATLSVEKTGYYFERGNGDGSIHSSYFLKNFYMDNKDAYCIEPGTPEGDSSTNYVLGSINNTTYNAGTMKKVALIAYFGYNYPGHNTQKYRSATQGLIWKEYFGENSWYKFSTEKNGAGETMSGVVYAVQISTDNGTTWTNYTPEGATAALELTTNASGQIQLQNFPITYREQPARFRFVEKSTPDTGYIIDNANLDYFYAQADGKTIVVHADGTQEAAATTATINALNEKPEIVKTVKLDDGTYDEQASASLTDTISFNITTDVPTAIADMTTFTVEDELPEGLTGRTNMKVQGLSDGNKTDLAANAYTKTEAGKK